MVIKYSKTCEGRTTSGQKKSSVLDRTLTWRYNCVVFISPQHENFSFSPLFHHRQFVFLSFTALKLNNSCSWSLMARQRIPCSYDGNSLKNWR